VQARRRRDCASATRAQARGPVHRRRRMELRVFFFFFFGSGMSSFVVIRGFVISIDSHSVVVAAPQHSPESAIQLRHPPPTPPDASD
jgi:hypothetical protein